MVAGRGTGGADAEQLQRTHRVLQHAATLAGGQNWEAVFTSDELYKRDPLFLTQDELYRCIRWDLKISPLDLSDGVAKSLFRRLDPHSSGAFLWTNDERSAVSITTNRSDRPATPAALCAQRSRNRPPRRRRTAGRSDTRRGSARVGRAEPDSL